MDKQNKINWIIELLLIILVIVLLIGVPFIQTDINQNEAKIDSLKNTINTLQTNQTKYDSTISNLETSLLLLNYQIGENENRIRDLKKKYDEKINNISNYSSTELKEFFTNRYK